MKITRFAIVLEGSWLVINAVMREGSVGLGPDVSQKLKLPGAKRVPAKFVVFDPCPVTAAAQPASALLTPLAVTQALPARAGSRSYCRK